MASSVNGSIQGTGNKTELKKNTVPSFLISVSREVKEYGHKDQEPAVPTIKSKSIGCVAFKIKEKKTSMPLE